MSNFLDGKYINDKFSYKVPHTYKACVSRLQVLILNYNAVQKVYFLMRQAVVL